MQGLQVQVTGNTIIPENMRLCKNGTSEGQMQDCAYVSRNLQLAARPVAALLPLSLGQAHLELQTQPVAQPSPLPSAGWSKREAPRSQGQAISIVRLSGFGVCDWLLKFQ